MLKYIHVIIIKIINKHILELEENHQNYLVLLVVVIL